jgi:hypothetical protein
MHLPHSPALELVDERVPVKVRRLIDLAKAVTTIETVDQRTSAGELHAQLGAERRETQRQQKEDVQLLSMMKKVEELRAPYTITIKTLDDWETFVSKRMGMYDTQQLRLARENQAKVNIRTDNRNQDIIVHAEKTGVRPILKAAPIVAAVAKTIKTDDGLSSSRKTVKVCKLPGLGPDEDPKPIPANDPRLLKIERANLLVNWPQLKKLANIAGMDEMLRAQGLLVEEEFDYTSRG